MEKGIGVGVSVDLGIGKVGCIGVGVGVSGEQPCIKRYKVRMMIILKEFVLFTLFTPVS